MKTKIATIISIASLFVLAGCHEEFIQPTTAIAAQKPSSLSGLNIKPYPTLPLLPPPAKVYVSQFNANILAFEFFMDKVSVKISDKGYDDVDARYLHFAYSSTRPIPPSPCGCPAPYDGFIIQFYGNTIRIFDGMGNFLEQGFFMSGSTNDLQMLSNNSIIAAPFEY